MEYQVPREVRHLAGGTSGIVRVRVEHMLHLIYHFTRDALQWPGASSKFGTQPQVNIPNKLKAPPRSARP